MPMNAHPILHQDADRVSFVDLPQELRDMVYAHLWRATPYLIPSLGAKSRNTFTVCYDNGHIPEFEPDTHFGLPQWLLTSKGVCYEGIKELLDKSYWHYFLMMRGEADDMLSRLVNPSLATRVTYQVDISVDKKWTGQTLEARIYITPAEQQLSTSALQLSSRAKHLTLEFEHIGNLSIGEYPPDTTWTVDLSAFDRIGLELESLTLFGVSPTLKHPGLVVPSLSSAFTIEMSRLGAVLLGQNIRIHVDKYIRKSTLAVGWEHDFVIKIKIVKL